MAMLTMWMPNELNERFKEICEELKVREAKMVEILLRWFLKEVGEL
jgi:hypothetical protein